MTSKPENNTATDNLRANPYEIYETDFLVRDICGLRFSIHERKSICILPKDHLGEHYGE